MFKLLDEMNDKDRNVWLFSSSYDVLWNCHLETKSDTLKVKIEETGKTPEEAVQRCYDALQRLTKGAPEIVKKAIEHNTDDNDEVPY